MQLRAIAGEFRTARSRSRRSCPGDWPESSQSWTEITTPFGEVEFAEMTIGYRIQRGVSEFTSVLVPRIAPSLEAPSSIRESESSSVVLLEADEDLVLEALAAIDSEEFGGAI